ncbi:P-loop containing nucleoside triphosphate hydrolase protein [Pisolithus microcarpus]|nr:P-loop containing nucleoside triphosphate hydrolase protein [Pisolithus microcarpus]
MISNTLNVILFGETGVGKSSVINLMAGSLVAEVSSDLGGCTMNSTDYKVTIGSRKITIWDTVGLEEPEMGVNGYYLAIAQAHSLIQKLGQAGGVDLLLFCIRGNRITSTTQSNYRLFYEILCDKQVPVAFVITNLEKENRMEDWWTRHESVLRKYGLKSAGHACVTCLMDKVAKMQESSDAISRLLSQHDNQGRYTMPPDPWFVRLRQYLASLVPTNSGSLPGKNLSRLLAKRCGLDAETAQGVAAQLRGY